ncbi:hypothetical protein JHK86_022578 [Glycine max]|nr:hypothetical protein JHK86_022578 [Glycine max]
MGAQSSKLCTLPVNKILRLARDLGDFLLVGIQTHQTSRTCPPWQGNSLETIMPENLPRPSARR